MVTKSPKQLVLNVTKTSSPTFANFHIGQNVELLNSLYSLNENAKEQFIYLFGEAGSGKSHLLQALTKKISSRGQSSFYLSFSKEQNLPPTILDNLDDNFLLCLDNLEHVIGDRDFEEALFHLYNRLTAKGGNLIIASTETPNNLNIELADLKSRLNQMLIFKITPLSDQDKILALEKRAKENGVTLPRTATKFLLTHGQRNLITLFDNLNELTKATLHTKRKISVKLIKDILHI